MAKDYTLLIGTVGQGLNVSADGGESWTNIRPEIYRTPKLKNTLPTEGNVRALCVYPDNPRGVLAGFRRGRFPQRRRRRDLGKPGCPHIEP